MLTTINKISCNLKDEMKKKNNLISIALVIVLIACSPTIEDSAEAKFIKRRNRRGIVSA